MTDEEKELLELIRQRAFRTGTFRLASGGVSSYYIDGKMIEVHGRSAFLIGEVLYQRTQNMDFDALGGLEVGAVPLATAAVISYHIHGREVEGFWVRDAVKRHGTEKLVEGNLRRGARVVVIDDVVTKGGSVLKAIRAVRDLDCEVVRVLALVDRLQGARELLQENDVDNYETIFTVRDLGVMDDVPGTAETAAR